MNFARGQRWVTRGLWFAEVIWVGHQCIYVIHKPGSDEESAPVVHGYLGQALTGFSVGEPPAYGMHPADLLELRPTAPDSEGEAKP